MARKPSMKYIGYDSWPFISYRWKTQWPKTEKHTRVSKRRKGVDLLLPNIVTFKNCVFSTHVGVRLRFYNWAVSQNIWRNLASVQISFDRRCFANLFSEYLRIGSAYNFSNGWKIKYMSLMKKHFFFQEIGAGFRSRDPSRCLNMHEASCMNLPATDCMLRKRWIQIEMRKN